MTPSTARPCALPQGQFGCSTGSSDAGCAALLRRAGADSGPDASLALEVLVEAWWPAVFGMARRSGLRRADAEDVTQDYFACFLEKDYAREAARWGGCLRPFLCTTVRHFLSNRRDHDRAQKRGGGWRHVSLGADGDAEPWAPEPRDPSTPETLLNERRADSGAHEALHTLAREMTRPGRAARFDRVAEHLVGDVPRGLYRALAEEWEVSESGVRIFVFRLRKRLRTQLRRHASGAQGTHRAARLFAVTLSSLSRLFEAFSP
jgi:DNA-directed RNA polymerase specialized sigma24 family protein